MPKVSVIVPVYKVENYLKRCVDSICNQTLSDIEIILVDDGSPDKCPQMCDEFAKSDSRIKVIHKQNGGLSSARNAGIHAATGKYLGYVDSDDYVDGEMFKRLYECAEKYQVDFVMEDYLQESDDGTFKEKSLDIREGLYTKEDIRNEIYPILIMRECVDHGPLLSVWHCIYKRNMVICNNLYFDEDIKYGEDGIYSSELGYKANSFYYMKHTSGYHYCFNMGSISKKYYPDAWDVYCLMNEKLHQFFAEKKDYDFSRQLDLHMLYYALNQIASMTYTNFRTKERYEAYKLILNDDHFRRAVDKLAMPDVGMKLKIIIILMKCRASLLLTFISSKKHKKH
jgi:glycosyltransferase involved in cell wall biosynthesis